MPNAVPNAVVFIDGNNLYFKLKELKTQAKIQAGLLDFSFSNFSKWLSGNNNLVQVRYYIGALKRRGNEKSEKMYADQQRLFAKLNNENISITLGQLIQHPDRSYHEKGVDVRLAVEMIRLARENVYDIAYLVSSDTDLVAAVEEVQSFGKQVCYIGIAKGQSFGLTKTCDDTRLLRPEEMVNFFPPTLLDSVGEISLQNSLNEKTN